MLLLCSAAPPHVQGQDANTLDPAKALTQYVHQAWQADEGLPQSTVGAITQTRDGYLWLGTEEGLVRFDGVRFTVFDEHNTEAFETGHAIETLLADPDGGLWIGTVRAGLVRHADGQFTRYAAPDGLTGREITALYRDAAGTLWVGTRDAGLFVRRNGRFEHRFAPQVESPHVTALLQDHQGILWVGTRAGLYRVERDSIVSYRSAGTAGGFVLALHEDRAGTLWVATRAGLNRLVDGAVQPYDAAGLPRVPIRALWEDDAGALWIGMEGNGLGRLYADRFETLTTADGLTHDWVLALYGDREGSLWIGTEAGGLNRLWAGKFTPVSTREGLSHDVTTAVYEDAKGRLWVGTDGGGLNRLDADGTVTVFDTANGLPSNIITSLTADAGGALWVGTLRGGLSRIDGGTVSVPSIAGRLPSQHIYALYADSDGSLWVGTDVGLTHLHDDRVTTYTSADGLGSNMVTTILEGRQGDLWVGTYDAGLTRLRPDDRFETYTTGDGLASNTVLSLYEDADGTLWIGTYEGGLSRIKNGILTTFTTYHGLFDNTVYALLEDASGRLWMSCNKGLFVVSKGDLDALADGPLDRVTSTGYGRTDGLRSPEMNGGAQPAAWKRHDGTLWFPSLEGVVGIDPQNIQHNLVPPPVVVEDVLADNRPIGARDELALKAGTKKLDFKYTALSFVASRHVRFRYFLEGYDTDWQQAGTDRTATYTNLPPGPYTFRVKARNSDGVWNEAGAVVSFRIAPYFYQTLWFYALCVVGVVGFVVGAYRWRVRHLKAREKVLQAQVAAHTEDLRAAKEQIEAQAERLLELDRFKTRFFANVSHEFRTPLTMIIGPLENALDGTYGALDGSLKRQAEIMLRNALRLMRLINQLLDLSKLEAGKMTLRARRRNLVPFVEGVVLSFTAFAEQKGLDLTFEADVPNIDLYYEPDKLEKVVFNLLSNAVKFTPADGTVAVGLTELPPHDDWPEGGVRIAVRDTGPGIPAHDLPHIFDRFRQVDGANAREHAGTGIGLALVKELVLLHHGTIDVESTPGVGTTFTVVLPKGDAHLQPEDLVASDADDPAEVEHSATSEWAFSASNFAPETELVPANGAPESTDGEASLVLVVEDNDDVREYVGGILGAHYRVATACDGAEGLERVRALRPDLVLSDVMMPKMDGNELCRRIKADPSLATIPVILLTARATQQSRIEGLEGGADDYLAKPFNARELLVRARNLLRLREQEKALRDLNATLEEKVEEQVEVILRERRAYEQRLLKAKEAAESSLRLKTAILNNLNHEFRTPLTVIEGYAQILVNEVPEELQEFPIHIARSGDRLMRTLDAVQQLSRIEAENIDVMARPLELGEAAREARRRFKQNAEEKGLRLEVDVADTPVYAKLDIEAFHRILDHLIDNAIKFTQEGQIVLQVRRIGDTAILRVQDSGIGIAEDFMPTLFEAFTQESTGLTRTHNGIGLGLAVTQRLVTLLGGVIDVESTKGQGSVFTVRFPVTEPPAPASSRRSRVSEAT